MKQTNKDHDTTIIKVQWSNNNQTIMIEANKIFDIEGLSKVTYVTPIWYKANKKKRIAIKIHKKRTSTRIL